MTTTPDREQALGGWQTIDTAPFTFTGIFPGDDADKWLDWSLLGRFDHHGFVMWVGGMDAGQWLYRDDNRSCGETDAPTHWMPLPPAPITNDGGGTTINDDDLRECIKLSLEYNLEGHADLRILSRNMVALIRERGWVVTKPIAPAPDTVSTNEVADK